MDDYLFCFDHKIIAGVDEVGCGALVGNVVAGAVILNPKKSIPGLKDSKKISRKRRLELFFEIQEKAISWNIGFATPSEIDRLNILQARMLAMQRAVCGLFIVPEFVLVDGRHSPKFDMPAKAIVHGDNFIKEISAASILAKITRDSEMLQLDFLFPEYGFAKHKGYPTKFHLEKLMKFGPIMYHRRSFSPIQKILLNIG